MDRRVSSALSGSFESVILGIFCLAYVFAILFTFNIHQSTGRSANRNAMPGSAVNAGWLIALQEMPQSISSLK
jgi:hypothetical protein